MTTDIIWSDVWMVS